MREDYGKTWFNIIDYTGSATKNFADPDFDGFPEDEDEVYIDDEGEEIVETELDDGKVSEGESSPYEASEDDDIITGGNVGIDNPPPQPPIKYYVDGGHVEIISHLVYELDEEGKQLSVTQLTDYTAKNIRTLFTSVDELQNQWVDPIKREQIIHVLKQKGINFKELAEITQRPDADPLDLLCYLAFDTPLRTRKERADYLKKNNPDFFDQYGSEARDILQTLLNKYTDFGPSQLQFPDALKVSPISDHGNVVEIAELFGGARLMKKAVDHMQSLLYHN
jgi:type I restriction enzyme R subunit